MADLWKETDAIKTIYNALDNLTVEQRTRVMSFVEDALADKPVSAVTALSEAA
jgi:hypothetical protein